MMKKVVFLIVLILLPVCVYAEDYPPFLNVNALPDAVKFLPAPPEQNSPMYYCDWNMYMWGKTVRMSPRGNQAKMDAKADNESLAKVFSEPLGIELSEQSTPKIFELIARTSDSVMLAIKGPKKYHQRTRPYALFNEKSLLPEEEASHNPKASYPSGHAAIGWGIALVLSEINPNAQDELLKRGYEFGQSRVIAGFHFQTDVDAGRLVASATIARLHADSEFMSKLKSAKSEFKKHKK
ncbi:MAG: phosphatase PAP2 family protein [Proteobacteria bacterium]|nr:phosphatase PAP2 family protein [Pseudomonadota bacterium]